VSQQFEEISRDPQMQQWVNALSWVLMSVFIAVLVADFVLLIRWLLARYRAQRAAELAPASLAATPAEPTEAPLREGEITTEAEEAQTAPIPVEAPAPPPRLRWSVVHVFVGGQIVIVLLSLVLAAAGFLFSLPILWRHTANPLAIQSDPQFKRLMMYVTVLALYLQNILMVGVVAFFLRQYGTSLAQIGLRRPTRRQILLGLGLGVAVLLAANGLEQGLGLLLQRLLGHVTAEKLEKFSSALDAGSMFKGISSPLWKAIFFVAGAIVTPIGEETFFRGFLYNALKFRYGVVVGIIFSGLIFALAHVSPLALLVIFPMGMILAYVYEKTGSLWTTIMMHMVVNGVGLAALWINGPHPGH